MTTKSRSSRTPILELLMIVVAILTCQPLMAQGDVDPASLDHLGGFWYVTKSQPRIYYFQDAGRYVDLFSYHTKDSNDDGIPNLKVSHDEIGIRLDSQGYPNHPTAIFPNSGNPNTIKVQDFHFRIPFEPMMNDHITRVPMGPIGVALNGVVFFNPFEAGGMNAVEGYSEVWLDSCCGHPEQRGVYHYHKYPVCVKSPFKDDGKQHSPVIGFAFDGFPVYGPYESEGTMAKNIQGERALDVCNGHRDDKRGYHYHATPGRFPYIVGGYAGVPDVMNIRGPKRMQEGAIEDNSSGESRQQQVIQAIRPGSAIRGKKQKLIVELDPMRATRTKLPEGNPDWVQIGPLEAIHIQRTGNQVEIEVNIPEDAPVGVTMDCHIEFATGRNRIVFKSNDVFRVIEDEKP